MELRTPVEKILATLLVVVIMMVFFTALPTVTRPPPGELTVNEGETITIECTAIGIPAPLIVWRLNWGPVGDPPRTTTSIETTEDRIEQPGVVTSHSVLTITQSRKADEGAYTCEALNTKGSIFAVPDTIVHILRKRCFRCDTFGFYPRDAMLARVIVIATCLSVCPSVCPSVT